MLNDFRDWRRMRRIGRLVVADRMAEALAAELPVRWGRAEALACQATAAALSGEFSRAEQLLDEAVLHPATALDLEDPNRGLRAAIWAQSGRYADVAALLGDDPEDPADRRLRATVAIEVGDDELAERLLTPDSYDGQLDEAMWLRGLGILHARRGRRDEGRAQLLEAIRILQGLPGPGMAVDTAYCFVTLARSSLYAGDVDGARAESRLACELMARAAHHLPGVAVVRIVAAEVHAVAGDVREAERHLSIGRDAVSSMQCPPLAAHLTAASAEVALARGDRQRAFEAFAEARAMHLELGERPEVRRVGARIAALG